MLHGTQSQPHTQPCFHVKSSLGTDLGRAPLLLHLDSNTWKSVVLTLSVFLFVWFFLLRLDDGLLVPWTLKEVSFIRLLGPACAMEFVLSVSDWVRGEYRDGAYSPWSSPSGLSEKANHCSWSRSAWENLQEVTHNRHLSPDRNTSQLFHAIRFEQKSVVSN